MDPCTLTYSDTDLLPGSCDFEAGWCNLSAFVNKNYTSRWNITSGTVGVWNSKINGDHTKADGSGRFAYLPLDAFSPSGLRAGLVTPVLPYPVCLTFWYRVADRTAKLFVLLQELDNTRTTLWTYTPQPGSWISNIKFPLPWTKQVIPVFSTRPFSASMLRFTT
ncbi:hypothetical protein CHS0354_038292 [Potamilus streckersoni]|uniref:MAM domain-containing protein n=1 Tax=Potamilus streckersoni TaxID=2493646 RepID=A0AAE0TDF6_9BIVA|nr:hypothetical protein CHS0354_038292 [Potamilus streckersoni]